MKAVVFERCGGPEVLELREVPDPRPRPDEVVVQVKACGINHLDLWVRAGLPGLDPEMPHILGNDVVGVALEVGPVARHVKPGDRVLVCPTLSCGTCARCHAGDDHLCRQYDVLGRRRNGGYAEQVAVPGVNCLPYPAELSWTDAAAVPLVFLTAWHMLVERCRIQPGEDVLVLGAGSGVGSAAIQIAKLFRCRVITTVGSDAKIDRAQKLGADHVLDHSRQNIAAEVRKLTDRRGVDIVFEHVGASTWESSLACLAHHGRLVTCGATTGYDARDDLRHLFAKQLTLLGSYMGSKAELLEVCKHVARGELEPVVSSVLPLAQAARAQEMMERREHFGKIVLAV